MKRLVKLDPFFSDQPEKAFVGDLKAPVHAQKPSFFSNRPPEAGEADARGLYLANRFDDDRGLLDVSYEDFSRFVGVCGFAGDRYPLRLKRGDAGGYETYTIRVTPEETIITSSDTEGIRRALICLEDEFTRREGPALPLGEMTRRPAVRSRITRCFFSPINRPPKYGDELSDDIDYYPENYLCRLMHDGANGVWIYTRFSDLVSVSALPEYGRNRRARIDKLNRVIDRCARYGIRVYVFAIEPVALPDTLSAHIPQADGGIAYNGNHLFCVNNPEGWSLVREAGARLFEACPRLGGFISITYGERPTSCSSAYSAIPAIGYRTEITCPRCRELEPGQVLANAVKALAEGIHSVSPEAEVISWSYGHRFWPLEDVCSYVRHAPDDAILMQNFEEMGYASQLGRTRQGVDYWLSYAGPSPLFKATARQAMVSRRRMYMKTQVCCSHELATVPYIPVPGLIFDKYREGHALNVIGVMQCWYFGNYPSLMSKAAGELAFEHDFADKRAFLEYLAGGLFGRSRAAAVATAWESFEAGYREYPLNIMFSYYGPMHDGPVWALHLKPKNYSLPRSWQTLDPTDGDRIGECLLEGHTLEEALTLAGRMEKRWREGLAALWDACRGCPEAVELLSVAEALQILFASGRNILRFYLLRDRLGRREREPRRLIGEMRRIVVKEIDHSKALSFLCERDGRLGYHSEGEGYKFFPKKLSWRIERLTELLYTEFPEIESRLRQNLPPLAYYAGEEPDAKAYKLCPDGIERASWEAFGEYRAFRASYDREELTVEFRSGIKENIHIGFEYRLMWPSPPMIVRADGEAEIPPEDYLYYSVFGKKLQKLRRLYRTEALPCDGTHLIIHIDRKAAGWTSDVPLRMRLAAQSGDIWCAEDNPIHTLGKSSVSPGEYGWLLP